MHWRCEPGREARGAGPDVGAHDDRRVSLFEEQQKTYALLQEVSKAALQRACGRITLAHTASEIYPFSVTSFHRVGTASGLYDEADVVPYAEGEAGDVR